MIVDLNGLVYKAKMFQMFHRAELEFLLHEVDYIVWPLKHDIRTPFKLKKTSTMIKN